MNTLVFILGFIIAVVCVIIIATVTIFLKIGKLEVGAKDFNDSLENLYRGMDDADKSILSEAKSYTDSRFDKIVFKK